jgi:hypothetical protein
MENESPPTDSESSHIVPDPPLSPPDSRETPPSDVSSQPNSPLPHHSPHTESSSSSILARESITPPASPYHYSIIHSDEAPGLSPISDEPMVNHESATVSVGGLPQTPESHEDPVLPIDGLSVTDSEISSQPPVPPLMPRTFTAPRRTRRPQKSIYRPARWRTPETDSIAFKKLRERALELKPLAGATEDQLENLLFLMNTERREVATRHRYREGEKLNGVVAHVDRTVVDTRKKNKQHAEQEILKAAETSCKAELDVFDRDTKRGEKELREHQKHQRNVLESQHQTELDELEEHWKSRKQFALYNRPTNKLMILRRQLAFALVESRFKDAEALRKIVDDETKFEEAENHLIMQRDYMEALQKTNCRQAEELTMFDDEATLEMQDFLQTRAAERRVLEIIGKKIAAREAIAADAEKLWILQQAKRSHAIVGNIGKSICPCVKLRIGDINYNDAEILNLPPLESKRKRPKTVRKEQSTQDS